MNRYLAKLCMGLALMAFLLVSKGFAAEEVALVRDGKPVGVIVVPEGATPQLKRSAEFLRDYIRKATGAILPIETVAGEAPSIHVGETSLVRAQEALTKELGKDGFILKRVDGNTFIIAGGSDWGTEFGVYGFLERYLGVRWLAPTELFTEIPRHDTVFLPEGEVRDVPTFLSRELYPIDVNSDPNDTRRASAPLWYRLGDEWGRFNRLRAHVEFHHNLKDLLPPSKFRVSHPEFYPILDGQRFVPPDDESFQWQPNFSAPGIARVAAEEINRHFDAHPEKDSYSLGINDSYRFDQSPESKARRSGKKNSINLEDVSDDYYQWANEVVDLVHEKHPGKRLGLLAYLQVIEPPTKIKVSPYLVPFITYENTRWENPEYRSLMQKVTLAWGEAAPNLGWYDYIYGSVYLVPRIFPHAERNALLWGAEHQVKYYYAEAIPNWGEGPSLWVQTKLLWNPKQDVDALLDDWCSAAVGSEAAPKLKEYYAIWERFWESDILSSRWYSAVNLWHDYTNTMYLNDVPLQCLERSDRLMNEVVALADTPLRQERARALQSMWKIYRVSVLARQGDELWKTADLQTDADVNAYVERCRAAIHEAEERLRLMGELSDDPLFGHSIFRFSLFTEGEEWGANSLWPLMPWVDKNENARRFLETLSAKNVESGEPLGMKYTNDGLKASFRHNAPKIAEFVLAAARGKAPQVLKNPSFEEGLIGWGEGPYQVTSQKAAAGDSSLRISSSGDVVVKQDIPYQTGAYIAKISALASDGLKNGKVTVSLTARNDEGSQIGRLLPTASVILHPGRWSIVTLPFTLETYSAVATKLNLAIHIEGLSAKDTIYLDDLGIFQVDQQERVRSGAGPDGE